MEFQQNPWMVFKRDLIWSWHTQYNPIKYKFHLVNKIYLEIYLAFIMYSFLLSIVYKCIDAHIYVCDTYESGIQKTMLK